MKRADLISRGKERSHKKLLQQAMGLTLIVLLLAGCGGAPAEPTSTPTLIPVPPTATPTPIPPTATPSVTPTVAPIVTLSGRLLYADSENPVADTSIFITGEEGSISFANGILVNPTGKTDSTGKFKVEIPEAFLGEQDYKIMVLVGFQPKMAPIMTQDGVLVVLTIESVPSENDLGDVLVQR